MKEQRSGCTALSLQAASQGLEHKQEMSLLYTGRCRANPSALQARHHTTTDVTRKMCSCVTLVISALAGLKYSVSLKLVSLTNTPIMRMPATHWVHTGLGKQTLKIA